MGSFKVCNVRNILSYKLQNVKLYTRNAVKYIFFYYRVSIECSIMV